MQNQHHQSSKVVVKITPFATYIPTTCQTLQMETDTETRSYCATFHCIYMLMRTTPSPCSFKSINQLKELSSENQFFDDEILKDQSSPKAQQMMYFLCQHRRFNLSQKLLVQLYTAVVKCALNTSINILVWISLKQDKDSLKQTMRSADHHGYKNKLSLRVRIGHA